MREDIAKLEEYLDNTLPPDRELKVLEAGCGSSSKFKLRRKKYPEVNLFWYLKKVYNFIENAILL